MAYDKVVNSTELDAGMTATANAIRAKTGNAGEIAWEKNTGFAESISEIPQFLKTQEKSVTPTTTEQEVVPDSEYGGLSKVTVKAMKTAEQATPSITVSVDGLITASTAQSAGYVIEGEKSSVKQLPVETWVFTMENGSTVEKSVVTL